MEETSGTYIAQSEIHMIRFSRGEWSGMEAKTAAGGYMSTSGRASPMKSFAHGASAMRPAFLTRTPGWNRCAISTSLSAPGFTGSCSRSKRPHPAEVIAHDSRTLDCAVVFAGKRSPNPEDYGGRVWIAATWSDGGQTIFALCHDEYQAHRHPGRYRFSSYMAVLV